METKIGKVIFNGRVYCSPESEEQAEVLEALRDLYEAAADRGYYTRWRHHIGGWGFYPLPDFALNDHYVHLYENLKNLPVMGAAAKVYNQRGTPRAPSTPVEEGKESNKEEDDKNDNRELDLEKDKESGNKAAKEEK